MICAIDHFDETILIRHDPPLAIVCQKSEIEHVPRKEDGHYAIEDLMPIVEAGNAVLYEEPALRTMLRVVEGLMFPCPRI
jgi:hypothetical protein